MKSEPDIPTVIYTHGGGRLGNQIIRWLHWLAWARAYEGQVRVVDLSFWPYAGLFEPWRAAPGCVAPGTIRWLDLLGRVRRSLMPSGYYRGERRVLYLVQALGAALPGAQGRNWDDGMSGLDLDSTDVAKLTNGAHRIFCRGWRIAGWQNVDKYQNELRSLFLPAKKYVTRANVHLGPLREKYDKVVGVFVRQSDYKTWNGGQFFFPVERYVLWMKEILAMEPGRKVAFLVASESRLDALSFHGLPFIFASGTNGERGHWFETFVELSMCDVILSPPSTFAATAAFIGNNAILPLVATAQKLDLRQLIENTLIGCRRDLEFGKAVR